MLVLTTLFISVSGIGSYIAKLLQVFYNGLLPRQLPHMGGDAVHDMKRQGPTTLDTQCIRSSNIHQTTITLIARPLSEKS